MDPADKVYTADTIKDVPFPAQPDQTTVTDTQSAPTTNVPGSAASIPQQSFPTQQQATELLSTALNTRTKKIIQEFQFAPSGALQIGDLSQGVNGDIRIDPNGIVARDINGDTTFALDGDTGDAFFAGEIRSGATITGDVTILDGGHILLYDNNGIPSIFIGELA